MAGAWIRGTAVTPEAAADEAARLLRASRMAVIAGLGTDVAGARAAIALARQIGAAVDHMHAAALLRDLDVMRESGMMMTTPNVARLRADLVVLVGPGLRQAWPELGARLLAAPRDRPRRVVWLCGDGEAFDADIERIGGPADLPTLLAMLRARCGGRPAGAVPAPLDALAAALPKATFGVAVWSASHLDAMSVEMLCGLVRDLNETTRFSGLPLAPPDNAAAVQQVGGWMTGFPVRYGFGRCFAEHDPWRFDATRLVDSGEADCALWISATGVATPTWKRDVPRIVLACDAAARATAAVAFAVGRPGVDHDAVMHWDASGTLSPQLVPDASATVSVADVLGLMAARLPEAVSC